MQEIINAGVKLVNCQSPHSTIWENKSYSFKEMRTNCIKYAVYMLIYVVSITFVILIVKDFTS